MKMVFIRNVATFTLMSTLFTSGILQAEVTVNSEIVADFNGMAAVDNVTLETMRGGFVAGNGVRFDIGIEKASYVDGVLQVQNSFKAEDLALLNTGLGISVNSANLENVSSVFNTLIQNNLDQKTIQNFTVIDVTVRNFSQLQNSTVESIRGMQDLQVIR